MKVLVLVKILRTTRAKIRIIPPSKRLLRMRLRGVLVSYRGEVYSAKNFMKLREGRTATPISKTMFY